MEGWEGKFGGVCKMEACLETLPEKYFLHQTSKFWSRGSYGGPRWRCSTRRKCYTGDALNVANATHP
jgi:hypothetical protein